MFESLDKLMFKAIENEISSAVARATYSAKPLSEEEFLQYINKSTVEAATRAGRKLTPMGVKPIPKRPHRKKRIRKKWMKKYGVNYRFNYSEQIPIENIEFTLQFIPEPIEPEIDTNYKPHFGAYSSCLVDPTPLCANICTGE